MRPRRLSMLLGSVILLILLGAVIWAALGVEAFYRLAPTGSDGFHIEMVNISQVRLGYRLPPRLPWSALYERLSKEGWVIRDDEFLVWPDLMANSHASAVFWRSGWLHLGRQWLTVHRDANDPQRFLVQIVQCVANVYSAPCD